MLLVEATLEDDGSVANAVWFNQPFLARQLQPGMESMVSGKVETSTTGLTFRSPVFERAGGATSTMSARSRRCTRRRRASRLVSCARSIEPLLGLATQVPDRLPPSMREAEGLMPIAEALYQVHVPDSLDDRRARSRAHRL